MLIPIRTKGNKQTLFCIPGALGNLGWLVEFSSAMGKEYAMYGLEPAGLKNWDQRQHSIEDLAKYYIDAIRTVQPRGPYCLLGYSFGGTVVYEMAYQFIEQQEDISHLIFLDAYAPWSETVKSLKLPDFFPWILIGNMFGTFWGLTKLFDVEDFIRLSPETYTDFAANYLFSSAKTLMSLEAVTKLIKNSVDLVIQSQMLVTEYKPKPYKGESEILFFQAQQGFIGPDNKLSLPIQADVKYENLHGWSKVFQTEIKDFHIPCDHFELLNAPYLNKVIEQIKNCFSQGGAAISTFNGQKMDHVTNHADKLCITKQLYTMIAEQLKIDQKKLSTDVIISNYGVSSLSAVMILQAINEMFGLELELEEIMTNFTINKLTDLIYKVKSCSAVT